MLTANYHHVFWPRRAITRQSPSTLWARFRWLPCGQVYLDFHCHDRLHVYSRPPSTPSRRHMERAVRRHNTGRCNCKKNRIRERTVWVDLRTGVRMAAPNWPARYKLPCFVVAMDSGMYGLWRHYGGGSLIELSPADLATLMHRHRRGLCACHRNTLIMHQRRVLAVTSE